MTEKDERGSKDMRIGLIRMRYTPYGGAEVFLERFIAELVRRGHGVDVFANSWPASSGVVVHHVPVRGPSFLKPLSFASNVEKAIKRAAPDVVISLERTHCQDIYRAGDGCHRQWLAARCAHVSWIKRLAIALNPFHMTALMLEEEMFEAIGSRWWLPIQGWSRTTYKGITVCPMKRYVLYITGLTRRRLP